MTRKKKTILAIVIVLVLVAAAVLVWFLRRGGGSGSGSGVYVQSVSDVNAAGMSYANRYSGVIETQKTDKVDFDTTKKLNELYVSEGQRVAKGAPLFSYDTQSIELNIQQAQLAIEKMNTTISNDNGQIAQLQKDMKAASSAEKPSYSAQIQELQAEIAQTQYDIKTKQAEIDKLNASIASSTVTAGMDGTVESVGDIDQIMAGNQTDSNGNQVNTFITILADGDFRVKGKASEQNIQSLYQDMPVIVRSRVDQSQTWTGTISVIDTQADNSDNNNGIISSNGDRASNYAFYVNLNNIDGLMLGQHVTIEPDYGQGTVKDGIWLSSGWIVKDGDSAYVWAAKSDGAKLEKRTVELGDYDEDMDEYQIVSGLAESDYLAWPDTDCVPGAATTTEYVMDDSDMGDGSYTDDGYVDDGMGDGSYVDDGMDADFGVDAQDGAVSSVIPEDAIGGEDSAAG